LSKVAPLAFVLLLSATAAHANDTSAELAAGGLVITRNDAIEMQAEDLFISKKAVRVTYRFVNTSGRDTTIRVAFPMPDIGGPGAFESDVSIPVEAPANILAFSTTADGKPVRTELEQKALVDGIDQSAWLKANGVPLALHLGEAAAALATLPQDKRDEALKLGLINEDGAPVWVLRSTYHWMQSFPAGRPVDHRTPLHPIGRGHHRHGAGPGSRQRRPDRAQVLRRQGDPDRLGPHGPSRRGAALRRALDRICAGDRRQTGRNRSATSGWWSTRAIPRPWSASAATG
jgi:hypothetical protein